ncbi:uncharacterized protein LOC141853166 [Brevipalpus obovatus]|uniref:uncharacterized protein LOC141853166 n=1 Tax=Brevipalpus obovatus TaxID=246614 RepID=UPI003D9FA5FD
MDNNNSVELPLYSSHAIKNTRRKMEDAHTVITDLVFETGVKSDLKYSYYAIFDGHAGDAAAKYCAENLHKNLVESPFFSKGAIQDAILYAYAMTDAKLIEENPNQKAGCTVVTCLLEENPATHKRTLYMAWAGDSIAMLVKNGRPEFVMEPHKAEREDERNRVEEMGGTVVRVDTWRISGALAISRAIGDPDFKPYVISSPDLEIYELDGSEDFLVVGCDGLWDQMTPDGACSLVYEYLAENAERENLDHDLNQNIARLLVNAAKDDGSGDNITTIVVFLRDVKDIIRSPSFASREKLSDKREKNAPFNNYSVEHLNYANSNTEPFAGNGGDFNHQNLITDENRVTSNQRVDLLFASNGQNMDTDSSALNKNGFLDNNNHHHESDSHDENHYQPHDTQASFINSESYLSEVDNKPGLDFDTMVHDQKSTDSFADAFNPNTSSSNEIHSDLNPFASEFEPANLVPDRDTVLNQSSVDGTFDPIASPPSFYESSQMAKSSSENEVITSHCDDSLFNQPQPTMEPSDSFLKDDQIVSNDSFDRLSNTQQVSHLPSDQTQIDSFPNEMVHSDEAFQVENMLHHEIQSTTIDSNQPESIIHVPSTEQIEDPFSSEGLDPHEANYLDTSGASSQFYSFMERNDLPPVSPIPGEADNNPFAGEATNNASEFHQSVGEFEEKHDDFFAPGQQSADENAFDPNNLQQKDQNVVTEKVTADQSSNNDSHFVMEHLSSSTQLPDSHLASSFEKEEHDVASPEEALEGLNSRNEHLDKLEELSRNITGNQPFSEALLNEKDTIGQTSEPQQSLLPDESCSPFSPVTGFEEAPAHMPCSPIKNEVPQFTPQFEGQSFYSEEKPSTPISDFLQASAGESIGVEEMLINSNATDQFSQKIGELGDEQRRSDTPLGDEKLSDSSPEQSLSPNPPPLSHESCDDVNLTTQFNNNENASSSPAPSSCLIGSVENNESKGHLFEEHSAQGIDQKTEDGLLVPKESPLELSQNSVITSPPPPSPVSEITTAAVTAASAAAVATAVAATLTSSSKKTEPASEKPVSKGKIVETKTAPKKPLLSSGPKTKPSPSSKPATTLASRTSSTLPKKPISSTVSSSKSGVAKTTTTTTSAPKPLASRTSVAAASRITSSTASRLSSAPKPTSATTKPTPNSVSSITRTSARPSPTSGIKSTIASRSTASSSMQNGKTSTVANKSSLSTASTASSLAPKRTSTLKSSSTTSNSSAKPSPKSTSSGTSTASSRIAASSSASRTASSLATRTGTTSTTSARPATSTLASKTATTRPAISRSSVGAVSSSSKSSPVTSSVSRNGPSSLAPSRIGRSSLGTSSVTSKTVPSKPVASRSTASSTKSALKPADASKAKTVTARRSVGKIAPNSTKSSSATSEPTPVKIPDTESCGIENGVEKPSEENSSTPLITPQTETITSDIASSMTTSTTKRHLSINNSLRDEIEAALASPSQEFPANPMDPNTEQMGFE